jgi:hypothetical protein
MSSAPRPTAVSGEFDLHVNYGSFDDLSMRQRAAERRRQLGQLYLFNVRGVGCVVAVPRPDGSDSDVSDLGPRRSFPAIGVLLVVRGHSRILCRILYLLGDALELHCLLVIPTDHKRYLAIPPEIRVLARRYKRVEDDLSLISGRDSDQRRLRLSTFVRRR